AFLLDGVGGVFTPLDAAPAFFPPGNPLFLSAGAAVAILAGVSAALALSWLLVRRRRPSWTDLRFPVALGMLLAALLVPVAGWAAHVATDYDRFIYFVPTPAVLLTVLTLEKGVAVLSPESAGDAAAPPRRWHARARPTLLAGYAFTAILLVLLFTNVTVPMGLEQEQTDTGPAHSSDFLAAAEWLAQNPATGNVLTLQSSARWVEAITSRGAFDIGPTWLDFEGWQIIDSQEAYFAFSSAAAITDNAGVLSFSNPSSPILSQAPMYSILALGVPVPVCRLLVGSSSVTVLDNGTPVTVPGPSWGPATLAVSPNSPAATLSYSPAEFTLSIATSVANGSTAQVSVTATGRNGSTVQGLQLVLGSPPTGDALLGVGTQAGIVLQSSGFLWNTTKNLGPLPTASTFQTTGSFSVAPVVETQSTYPNGPEVTAQFSRPASATPFTIGLTLSTPGSGNPGVTLPPSINATGFLDQNGIRFLFILQTNPYAEIIQLYESTLGFHVVFANSSWEILER
ncbi:MAG TPA: hypothetical protein VGU43_00295, partial [Thermoplasmata archaeon]|nr:hypothetical protein [Thermoplasmata archaeon]